VVDGQLRRGIHHQDPPTGWQLKSHLRIVGRRRFLRRRRTAQQSHRQAARLHLRGQRTLAQERARAGRIHLP
jgi:hypothetical protein